MTFDIKLAYQHNNNLSTFLISPEILQLSVKYYKIFLQPSTIITLNDYLCPY